MLTKKNQMTVKQHILLSNSVRTMCSTPEGTTYLEKQVFVCCNQHAVRVTGRLFVKLQLHTLLKCF